MLSLLARWIVNAAALLLVAYLYPGVHLEDFVTALAAALVLGLVNAVVRPLLVILTLPVTILTLGLFIFVINGLLFWAVGSFVPDFQVSGFWAGFFGAIVFSLISWILSAIFVPRKDK